MKGCSLIQRVLYIIVKENMIFEGLHNVEFDFNFRI